MLMDTTPAFALAAPAAPAPAPPARPSGALQPSSALGGPPAPPPPSGVLGGASVAPVGGHLSSAEALSVGYRHHKKKAPSKSMVRHRAQDYWVSGYPGHQKMVTEIRFLDRVFRPETQELSGRRTVLNLAFFDRKPRNC